MSCWPHSRSYILNEPDAPSFEVSRDDLANYTQYQSRVPLKNMPQGATILIRYIRQPSKELLPYCLTLKACSTSIYEWQPLNGHKVYWPKNTDPRKLDVGQLEQVRYRAKVGKRQSGYGTLPDIVELQMIRANSV